MALEALNPSGFIPSRTQQAESSLPPGSQLAVPRGPPLCLSLLMPRLIFLGRQVSSRSLLWDREAKTKMLT